MPDHLHLLIGISGESSLSKLAAISNGLQREKEESNGRGIFSIIGCVMMKAKRRSMITSVRIQFVGD
jgi:hypothetical protein